MVMKFDEIIPTFFLLAAVIALVLGLSQSAIVFCLTAMLSAKLL